MFQALYEYDLLPSSDGVMYRPRAYGQLDLDQRWSGWLVFFPLSNDSRVIATVRETTREGFAALLDWATGLTPVYLEGALERALDLQALSVSEGRGTWLRQTERDTATWTGLPSRFRDTGDPVAPLSSGRRLKRR